MGGPERDPFRQPSAEAPLQRESWMLSSGGKHGLDDVLAGGKRRRHADSARPSTSAVSQRELNPVLRQQAGLAPLLDSSASAEAPSKPSSLAANPDRGSKPQPWLVMKAKRVLEMAEREGRHVNEVALERFQSLDEFHWALSRHSMQSQSLSQPDTGDHSRDGRADGRRKGEAAVSESMCRRSSRSEFQRPDQGVDRRGRRESASRGDGADDKLRERERRRDDLIYTAPDPGHVKAAMVHAQPRDPRGRPDQVPTTHADSECVSSSLIPIGNSDEAADLGTELNRIQAHIVRARIRKDQVALERCQKEADRVRGLLEALDATGVASASVDSTRPAETLQPFDERGRYRDVGRFQPVHGPQRRKHRGRVEEAAVDKRDADMSVQEMLRQEKASRGVGSNSSSDYARHIARDARYENQQDYLDSNASQLARGPALTEDRKRQLAILSQDRMMKVMDRCPYCLDDVHHPTVPVMATGSRVYLSLPKTQPLVPNHCSIVPMHHHVSSLDCDDDEWDEIRNFMKCVTRMFHALDQQVVFMETAIEFRRSWHCHIDCIPVARTVYDQAPAFFRQTILENSEEWAQNRKLIDSRTSGFRRSLVSNLPYFHVWFGLDGGYGHIVDEDERFPFWFGNEVLAGMMNIPAERWRRPRALTFDERWRIERDFKKLYQPYDWTHMLA